MTPDERHRDADPRDGRDPGPGHDRARAIQRAADAPPPAAGSGAAEEHASLNFEADVEEIHRTLLREQADPDEGREPAPWWVWATIVVGLFWGGWYLGRFGGNFDESTHVAFARGAGPSDMSLGAPAAAEDPLAVGARVYQQNCQACHQSDGLGVPGNFPPLIGAEWVTGPPETVVRILLHGLNGPIPVAGTIYNGNMPAWSEVLGDVEIAAVSTYIRQWETNEASAVPPELVAALREATADRTQPYTAEALRAAEAEGPLEVPGAGPPAPGADSADAAPGGPAAPGAAPAAPAAPPAVGALRPAAGGGGRLIGRVAAVPAVASPTARILAGEGRP